MRIQRLAACLHRRAVRRFHVSRVTNQRLECFADVDSSWEWLKNPTNARLQRFLKLERTYLANQLAKPKFRKVERMFNLELRNRLLRENYSVPECIGKFEYYMRQAPRDNFPVYYRRCRDATKTSTKGAEQVVLNQNVEPLLNYEFHIFAV
uniref:Peptidase S9A N-terminal domain-containing protein n=1 Tax=Peronospora matthiolae TaxID=2874970 RepID=A0AAV1V5E8_9STRA